MYNPINTANVTLCSYSSQEGLMSFRPEVMRKDRLLASQRYSHKGVLRETEDPQPELPVLGRAARCSSILQDQCLLRHFGPQAFSEVVFCLDDELLALRFVDCTTASSSLRRFWSSCLCARSVSHNFVWYTSHMMPSLLLLNPACSAQTIVGVGHRSSPCRF